ncbi:hypothetical protein T484DRAFT_1833594 [Baffinella frigidus]|nr:hypothetical protein T484DRAFT_1833594 [Cryptophyta sp. CCMP2293]
MLLEKGDIPKARKTYAQVAKTLARFGAMLLEKGDIPEARYNLEQTLARFGAMLLEKGDVPEARYNLELNALCFSCSSVLLETLARLGAMLLEKGDIPEARYNLEQALRIMQTKTDTTARVRLSLGECFRVSGNFNEALVHFEEAKAKAMELAPKRRAVGGKQKGGAEKGGAEVHPDALLLYDWVEEMKVEGMKVTLRQHGEKWNAREATLEGPDKHDPSARVVVTILPMPRPETPRGDAPQLRSSAPEVDKLDGLGVSVRYKALKRAWDDPDKTHPSETALIVAEAHR